VDEQARYAALNGAVFERLFPQVDFQSLARSVLLREWQGKWNAVDTGSSVTPYSRRFLFNLGLNVKGNLFPLCRE
jgi:hypothetical protein